MLVALIAHDKPGSQSVRQGNRTKHLDYLNTAGQVAMAGPLLDGDGGMIGSLIVLDVPDMAAAQKWADGDPYALAGLFESVTLREWNKVIG